jgi:hypothetical protein
MREQSALDPIRNNDIGEAIDDLELDLLKARDADLNATSVIHKADDDLMFINEAFYSVAVLLFYTRLRDLVWTAPLIRKQVGIVCSNLACLRRRSRAELAVIFPYFFAGCETVDLTVRKQIIQALDDLPANWFNRSSRAAQCLENVWSIRDKDPSATWLKWHSDGLLLLRTLIKQVILTFW